MREIRNKRDKIDNFRTAVFVIAIQKISRTCPGVGIY
jgi:hypothetical protein